MEVRIGLLATQIHATHFYPIHTSSGDPITDFILVEHSRHYGFKYPPLITQLYTSTTRTYGTYGRCRQLLINIYIAIYIWRHLTNNGQLYLGR